MAADGKDSAPSVSLWKCKNGCVISSSSPLPGHFCRKTARLRNKHEWVICREKVESK